MKRMLRTVLALAFVAGLASSAHAGLVLETGGIYAGTRGSTTEIVISATNNGSSPVDLAQFTLGFQVVPMGYVLGGVDVSDITAPATGSAWVDSTVSPGPWESSATLQYGPPIILPGTATTGTSDYWTFNVSAVDPTMAPGAIGAGFSRALAAITFSWTGDPSDLQRSTWAIYAVNEFPLAGSLTTSYYDPDLNIFSFDNLPPDSATDAAGSARAILIATVEVGGLSPAVPEIDPIGCRNVVAVFVVALGLLEKRRGSPPTPSRR